MALSRSTIVCGLVLLSACGSTGIDVKKVLDPATLGGQTPVSFGIAEDDRLLVQTETDLYDAHRKSFVLPGPSDAVSASCLTGPSPLVVRGGSMLMLEDGQLTFIVEVPLQHVRLALDSRYTYIAGVSTAGDAGVFVYAKGSGHQQILRLPVPADAIFATEDEVLLSVDTGIFSFAVNGPLIARAMLPGFGEITSLTLDPDTRILYFSDGVATYALTPNEELILVFRDAGGPLQWHRGSLYLLTRQDKAIYKIASLSRLLLSDPTVVRELR
jgi:hypothetical protein